MWMIIGWICKIFCILIMISGIIFLVQFIRTMATNGGRKWHYYNPNKPWEGGYWEPLLPNHPPYNEYKRNAVTYRF